MHFLREVQSMADDPDAIAALIHVVDDDLGYHLYRAVERSKVALSGASQTDFAFRDEPVDIARTVARDEFEHWIREPNGAIADCVDGLLRETGVSPREVDRVFMTGGSSFVPAVREIFASRFGADRLRAGDELTSVAMGLALRARDLAR
jgi:hypothetical chaperone protein